MRPANVDKLLLATLLPAFGLALGLHVKENLRTGRAQPPVFAVPAPGGDGYPIVGGARIERQVRWNGLEVGDRLIRVGDEDLRGVGYIGFEAIALEQGGAAAEAPLVFERDGVRHETVLRMSSLRNPWHRLPFLAGFVLLSVLVLLRSPGNRQAQLLFAGFVGFAILETPFYGGPRLQTWANQILFNFGGFVAIGLLMRWVISFPDELLPGRRLSPHWAWIGLVHLVARFNYHLGAPFPPEYAPVVALSSDAVIALVLLTIATWNYVYATPIGRRRVKWVLLGGYVTVLPTLVAVGLQVLAPTLLPAFNFSAAFEYTPISAVALPIGVLVGIARYNLFDIDRLISSAASYSLTAVLALAAIFALVPWLAGGLAAATGASHDLLQLVLTPLLAAALVVAHRALRPRLDRLFFPERLALERGVELLLGDLSECRSGDEVDRLVGERLGLLLRPETCAAYRREGERLVPVHGGDGAIDLGPLGSLVVALESRPVPLRVRGDELGRSLPELEPAAARAVARLGAEVLVPLRRGKDLGALVVLGARRSGDIYTDTDLALLATVAERASAQLLHVRDAETIVEERLRAEELRELKERAESANVSRSRFLAAASHDLRQPLHALALLSEALVDQTRDDRAEELAERIRGAAASLGEMFDGLLDVSRLDVGGVDPQPVGFALDSLLERLIGELAPVAEAKGLRLRWSPSSERVRSDPLLLRRILQNLLSNAIRYTEKGEVEVRVRADQAGERVRIEVRDTGPGIPEDRQRDVFREFVQIGGRGSERGLGLGLSIVERTARLLGHPVDLASRPGAGSTFAVAVPRARETEPAPIAAAPGVDLAGRRIAVLDDDLEVLAAMHELLTRWGCRVIAAASLADLRDSLERLAEPPDAILADYRLAGDETGLDAIAWLRAHTGLRIPAAIVTGETAAPELEAIRSHGLRSVTKPLRPFRLRALLLELLRDGEPGA
ncbi:MAG: hybrid sensor histidine kinase/response regulator [Myxococcota bacterium]|nr:hybrid sensor histidine kinase/response regulator [Myxococcota bacterium]